MRTPLEIRYIAEEFCGRTITHDDSLRANVMGLFQRKLSRMEDEARTAAGAKTWSTGLPLLSTVLSTIVDLTHDLRPPMVEDRDIIRLVQENDDEFTAERIRFALQRLVSHGLVDEWQPASRDLVPAWPVYGVATRHLSDFVVAQSAVTNVLPLLRCGQRPNYPASFVARPEAAILFAALLAEEGYFVTDDIWADETRPAHITMDFLSALALVAPRVAEARRDWVQQVLLESTKGNREALRRVIVPVARLPHHPLGPRLLDEALRSLPLAERDPIWSVPDDLSGTGPWQGWAYDILDKIDLDAEGDPWDGRPLVLAWICSSVVEARRRRARVLLAVWGSRRLGDMVHLLDHMARVDDPQIIEDVVVAALGAVSGAPFNDEALIPLAMTVDRLFFRDDAEAWTPDVIVHIAARGIVERVALLCPGAVDHLLKRARPPYEPRGPHWPELDMDEARDHSFSGGKIVTRDLSWYVADHCFSPFLTERRERRVDQGENLLASVDKDVLDAVLAGRLDIPGDVVQRYRAMVEQRNQWTQQSEIASANLLQALQELYAQEVTEQGEPLEPLDEKGLLRWAMEQHGSEDTAHARKPQWSDELRALYAHASQVAGVANIAPDAMRNALIAAKVRSWGWSEIGFCCYDWNKLPERVDRAIVKRHGAGASHGSRSAVATFREKYGWAAVNCVAGELADRLPVWNDVTGSWRHLDRLEQLGTGMPDPLPRSAPDSPPVPATEYHLWIPDELWPELFVDEALVRRAERWLSKAPLPNPRAFVRGRIESWQDAAVLAASLFRRGHQGCIDQAVWVATVGVPAAVAALFKRDTPQRWFDRLHAEFVGLGDTA